MYGKVDLVQLAGSKMTHRCRARPQFKLYAALQASV